MEEGGGCCTPDDRSGSMANLRRTQSQKRFAEGRVCFVLRARAVVSIRGMDWVVCGEIRLSDIVTVLNQPRSQNQFPNGTAYRRLDT
jgi:hypothetical protein